MLFLSRKGKLMDNNFDPKQRRDPRVRKPLIIRFRDPQTDTHWESAQTLNVSRSGLCFYTSKQYQPKAILEIRMSSIILQKEMDYTCLVVRSFPSQRSKYFMKPQLRFSIWMTLPVQLSSRLLMPLYNANRTGHSKGSTFLKIIVLNLVSFSPECYISIKPIKVNPRKLGDAKPQAYVV